MCLIAILRKRNEIEHNKSVLLFEWDLYFFVLEFGFTSMLKECIANNNFI